MKVLGMGNALVDIVVMLPNDDYLNELDLPKGSMQLVDIQRSEDIFAKTLPLGHLMASGGSAANTIHGLAALGVQTGFVGSLGEDELGEFFTKDMSKRGTQTLFMKHALPSGRAMALVSQDSERTFGTYLGAAFELSPEHITSQMFAGYDVLHIEGYLVQKHDLIERAVSLAKQAGLMVSLDLASYNVVEDNHAFLSRILKEHIDLVFANEEEAKAMTGKEPKEALLALRELCSKAVVKVGKQGSWVWVKEPKLVDAMKASPVDTSGAGDLYAAGFIYGLSKGMDDFACGKIGSLIAGKVIEVAGPKLSEDTWKVIRNLIKV